MPTGGKSCRFFQKKKQKKIFFRGRRSGKKYQEDSGCEVSEWCGVLDRPVCGVVNSLVVA